MKALLFLFLPASALALNLECGSDKYRFSIKETREQAHIVKVQNTRLLRSHEEMVERMGLLVDPRLPKSIENLPSNKCSQMDECILVEKSDPFSLLCTKYMDEVSLRLKTEVNYDGEVSLVCSMMGRRGHGRSSFNMGRIQEVSCQESH